MKKYSIVFIGLGFLFSCKSSINQDQIIDNKPFVNTIDKYLAHPDSTLFYNNQAIDKTAIGDSILQFFTYRDSIGEPIIDEHGNRVFGEIYTIKKSATQ